MSSALKGGLLGLLAVVLLSGCAIGNKHNYGEAMAEINVKKEMSIIVAAQDQRPYVLSGSKSPDFVGLQRGGFGNPFDVTTQSGRPLADDIAGSVARSLVESGAKARSVAIGSSQSQERVLSQLSSEGSDRLLFLRFTEWKSDTYNNTALLYDMHAYVFDSEGKLLAESAISGKDNLGGSAINPPGHAKEAVPQAFKRKLEELFGAAEVSAALR